MNYRPRDWYWLADDGRVFASGRQLIVDRSDAGLAAFEAAGGLPTRWPADGTGAQTIAALQDVLTPYGLFADLKAYAAAARYTKETAGITVGNAPVATDRDSQAMINGMWAAAQINPAITVQFKSAGGGFAQINAAQIQSIAAAVIAHVQACFTAEAQVDAAITAGTITTTAPIDAAFAAITV